MHNLHIGVCYAKNNKEAEVFIENETSDWGTENNWRTICGSVGEDGEVHSTNEGRWEPLSIKALNEMVNEALVPTKNGLLDDKAVDYTLDLYHKKKLTNEDYFNCYIVSQYFKKLSASLSAKKEAGKERFDFFKHSYNENVLDEFGVSHFGIGKKGLKKFAVFIDMHS